MNIPMPSNTVTRISSLIAALLLVAATLALSAAPARAAVSCGAVVTTDLTLTEDLVCNGVDALIVGADGVTIDLGGFTISNTGGGIVNGVTIQGHTGVTVRNGSVVDYYRNVIFDDSPYGVALDLTIRRGGGGGLFFFNSDYGVAKRIDVRDVHDGGVVITGSTSVSVSEITARTTTWGVFVTNSVGATITDSDLRQNFQGVAIYLAHGTTVSDSIIRDNSQYGVVSEDSTKTNIVSSKITRNGIGVLFLLDSDGGLVQDNQVNRNSIGVQLGTIGWPTPYPADGVRVLDNVVSKNDGSGIVVDQAILTGFPHRIADNTVNHNGADPAGLVDSANDPLDDGIHVIAPPNAVELGDNGARKNADYGIDANVATDLGGNTASQNGNVAQCIGVSC